jgi:acyl carrier protein
MSDGMFQKVQTAIFEETGEWVTPEARIKTLVTDSLELASLVTELENATGIDIPDEDMQKIFTVQNIVDYVRQHDKASNAIGCA